MESALCGRKHSLARGRTGRLDVVSKVAIRVPVDRRGCGRPGAARTLSDRSCELAIPSPYLPILP